MDSVAQTTSPVEGSYDHAVELAPRYPKNPQSGPIFHRSMKPIPICLEAISSTVKSQPNWPLCRCKQVDAGTQAGGSLSSRRCCGFHSIVRPLFVTVSNSPLCSELHLAVPMSSSANAWACNSDGSAASADLVGVSLPNSLRSQVFISHVFT